MNEYTLPSKAVTTITFFFVIAVFLTSCKGKNAENANDSDLVKKPVPGAPIKYDSSKRYIYLTFDDGPWPPGTNICKQVFHSQGVKATFFMVGMHQFDVRRKRLVDSIRNSYPEFLLANHSYTHAFRDHYGIFYKHPDSAVADILQAQRELNVPVKIVRLPGNNVWAGKDGITKGPKSVMQVAKKLDSLGYNIIGWDVEWNFINKGGSVPKQSADAMAKTVQDFLDNSMTNEENHIVILAHDRMFQKPQYTDSLTKFISTLKSDTRNVFETIDHYPALKPNN